MDSSLSSFNVDLYKHIEDLFTMGFFEEAYKACEVEIASQIAAHNLPSSLLRKIYSSSSNSTSTLSKDSTLHNSDGDSKQKSLSTLENGSKNSKSLNSNSSSVNNQSGSNSYSSSKSDYKTYIEPNFDNSINRKPHSSSQTSSSSSTSNQTQSKPNTSKSIQSPSNVIKNMVFELLNEEDQVKMRKLMLENVAIIAIMIQCLFELNMKDKIIDIIKPLYGERYEQYPFEISFLILNLLVSENRLGEALTICKLCSSNLKSQLGPIPQRRNRTTKKQASSASSNSSSPSSSVSNHSYEGFNNGIDDDYSDDFDEDENSAELRRQFSSLSQLFIFHILIPLNMFEECKSWLSSDERLYLETKLSWIELVREAEENFKNNQKIEAQKIIDNRNQNKETKINTNQLDVRSQKDSKNERLATNNSWISFFFGSDDFENWSNNTNRIAEPDSSMNLSLDMQKNAEKRSFKAIILNRLKSLVILYRRLSQLYNNQSPAFKRAIDTLVGLCVVFLIYLITYSKWYKNVSGWIFSKLGISRPNAQKNTLKVTLDRNYPRGKVVAAAPASRTAMNFPSRSPLLQQNFAAQTLNGASQLNPNYAYRR